VILHPDMERKLVMKTNASLLTIDEFFDTVNKAINDLEASGILLSDIRVNLKNYNYDNNFINFWGEDIQVNDQVDIDSSDSSSLGDLHSRLSKAEAACQIRKVRAELLERIEARNARREKENKAYKQYQARKARRRNEAIDARKAKKEIKAIKKAREAREGRSTKRLWLRDIFSFIFR